LGQGEGSPHRVHGHAVEGVVERGEQANELDVRLLAEGVKGPGAVLA